MIDRLFYPCVITVEDGIHYAEFPDFEACFTDGTTFEETLANAKDVLTTVLMEMASKEEAFPVPGEYPKTDGIVVYLDVIKSQIINRSKNLAIKKTITIPKWLNDVAMDQNINFSQTMQEALELKIKA